MRKEFKVPSRRQPIFRVVGWFFGLFYKAKVEILTDNLPQKAIVLANHSAKAGPMALELSYPHFNVKWGAHEMLGNYKSRYNYLRNVLYIQKLKKGKLVSTVKAAFEAIFSIWLYRGMKFIPTYSDARFRHSIRCSMDVLESGASVMIFPEDSTDGYFDELTSAFPGFVMLWQHYFRKTGEDLPVIPVYYHKRSRKIVVGKPQSVKSLFDSGLNRDEIAEHFKDEINFLFREHFKNK